MNKCIILLNLLFVVNASLLSNITQQKYVEDGIIPDVIDVAPSKKFTVIFDSDKKAELGNHLTPTEVKNQPKIEWEGLVDPKKYYVLAMVDPDIPSRLLPILREYKHWLIGNIPGNNFSSKDAVVIAPYQSPVPPRFTGFHRYIFLLYEQKDFLMFDEPKGTELSPKNRPRFSVKSFAKKYNLGDPIAGNYFKAKWDEYVDEKNLIMINDLFKGLLNKTAT
ncbi:unnamed protein product [Brassicogethes aeneus]|uniref:Phosphatidylethanolamine-binding protein n=1 Tax=Brassicogethes aeneus TaxID=1431903 RepID=A0A9P0B8F4_BRAAE|nr:unnamed protein product [Brassicogethes aeneus]